MMNKTQFQTMFYMDEDVGETESSLDEFNFTLVCKDESLYNSLCYKIIGEMSEDFLEFMVSLLYDEKFSPKCKPRLPRARLQDMYEELLIDIRNDSIPVNVDIFCRGKGCFYQVYDIKRKLLQCKLDIIREELLEKAWHPDRFYDWCLDNEEKSFSN